MGIVLDREEQNPADVKILTKVILMKFTENEWNALIDTIQESHIETYESKTGLKLGESPISLDERDFHDNALKKIFKKLEKMGKLGNELDA